MGGAGNDVYVVVSATDTIVEVTGEGTDEVRSSVDYALGGNVDNLMLTGTAVSGTGNSLSNIITGNASGNSLDGGTGADQLIGGEGDDTLTDSDDCGRHDY
ncbi:MAG: calcium-binding protein [Proteobacteria bacterium]|nr:calcium-binding protein [Pseudomonadota bacterium]